MNDSGRLPCQGCEEHPITITYTTALPYHGQIVQVSLCWACWDRFVVSYTALLVRTRTARARLGLSVQQGEILAKASRAFANEWTRKGD